MSAQIPIANGNALFPAIPVTGYLGTGNDLNRDAPDVLRTSADGSGAGETSGAFLGGDLIVHGPNAGDAALLVWTAPAAGSIDFTGSVWYAHPAVNRCSEVTVSPGGTVLGSQAILTWQFGNRGAAWP